MQIFDFKMVCIFLALEKFLDQAKLYPEESKFDIVAKYCQTSGECTEIVGLLEGQKRKPSEVLNIYLTFYPWIVMLQLLFLFYNILCCICTTVFKK